MNWKKAFLDLQRPEEGQTLGDAFAELRHLCKEENDTLGIPPRSERPNPFPNALEERSR